ncbi:MAG: LexA family protein [Ruminiclostridium sp.]
MNNIGELIEKRRKELGLTLEEVGNYVGVGKSTVKKWETGLISNMRRDKISLLAKILQINPTELIGDYSNDLYSQFDNVSPISTQRIPLIGEIACGKPIFCEEDRESYVEVGTDIRADFCLRAKGDSMINARICDGDIVFIRQQPMVDNGEIAAVVIEDEATLKRVYYDRDNGKLVLQAENPKYSPLVYVGEELNSIRILGKAIAFESNL